MVLNRQNERDRMQAEKDHVVNIVAKQEIDALQEKLNELRFKN